MTWSQAAEDFVPEGSLRDIYVRHVSHDDWETIYHWLLRTYPHVFTRNGTPVEPPPSVEFIWEDRKIAHSLLTLQVSGIRVNCHFFQSDDLELDLRPEAVVDEERFTAVTDLMIGMGRQVDKQVVLTYENDKDRSTFLEFRPEDGAFVYHKPRWR